MSSTNADDVLDHLSAAIDELQEAREKAGHGTSMMVGSIIDDIESLRSRYENIND